MSGETASLHATAVVVREAGIVLRGPSGAGKSTLAHLLIEAAHGRGWFARLVGDDRLLLRVRHGAVLAAPHPAVAGLLERRTQPLARVPSEPCCRVDLVVDLLPLTAPLPRLPEHDDLFTSLAGIDAVPRLVLPGGSHALWCGMVFAKLAG